MGVLGCILMCLGLHTICQLTLLVHGWVVPAKCPCILASNPYTFCAFVFWAPNAPTLACTRSIHSPFWCIDGFVHRKLTYLRVWTMHRLTLFLDRLVFCGISMCILGCKTSINSLFW